MSRFHSPQNILPPVQSVNVVNPILGSITPNQEGNTLIWLDESLNSKNEDIFKTKETLRSINDYVLLFTDREKYLECVISIKNDNIFTIISGKSCGEYLSLLHQLDQVKAIFIFWKNDDVDKPLQNDYKKIAAVCTEQDKLIKCLQETIRFFNYNASSVHLLKDKNQEKSHVNALDAYNFKKQQIIKNIILRMPQTENCKKKLVNSCRSYYKGNQSTLKSIDEFDQDYKSSNHAIKWYTKNSFLFRIINNALRIGNIELLEIFHYYIIDLSKSLIYEADQWKKKFLASEENVLSLYRGQQLSHKEYEHFIRLHGYIVFNSYLSTSTDINIAKMFVGSGSNTTQGNSDIIGVLFHIEIDAKSLNNSGVILADISHHSTFEECEYLFDIGATFEVIDIDHKQHIIKMILSNKAHHFCSTLLDYEYLYKYGSKQLINMTPYDSLFPPPDNYGESLLHIDKTFKTLDAFETYILKASIDDTNYQTGCKYCLDGYSLSRHNFKLLIERGILDPNKTYVDKYTSTYNQALEHFQTFHKTRVSNVCRQYSFRALAFVHYKIGNFEESEKNLTELLELNNDPLNLATYHYFLGCIHGKLSKKTDSMNNFNQVLKKEDEIHLSFIAATYCQMALFGDQSEEQYLIHALNIYKQINEELSMLKCRSELLNLRHIPHTIENCIEILDHYLKYCREHHIRAPLVEDLYLTLGKESFDHLNLDLALECYLKLILNFSDYQSLYGTIADIYIVKGESKLAIDYLTKMLKSTEDTKKNVYCCLLMGIEYSKLDNFDEAFKYLEQSLSRCEQSDSGIEFNNDLFDFELKLKSQITTCESLSESCNQKYKMIYFYNKALLVCLDYPKLFRPDLTRLLESIDHILGSKYVDALTLRLEEINNDNETSITKFILETCFDIYMSMCDASDECIMIYYLKAFEIYHNQQKITIDRDINICISKIVRIIGSPDEYDKLAKDLNDSTQIPEYPLEFVETKEEQQLFHKNYVLELKRYQLAKIYSYIGDTYVKTKMFDKAKLYYDKSIDYYKTFSLLFHLELAELYSKKAQIVHFQFEQQIIADNNTVFTEISSILFENSIAALK